ncbi:hypothetical protein BX661DRAFT_178387 [Kickxella alabastrina]|uniref:uncharacterized protein n=1 Tax=Kickxella alabastrina TaxID=61397 RepID=UPI00221FA9E4|nr:uncharacterized protein BX661DRAFT_182026 [Kickxella alabastrina]XP_051393825.1 uncharacterized protein BX661DRAFT_178387 [Kickxella alabastrina]KAI7828404.1 hypothetical protein BX661DRAFT_182026 [Kickxella alabastrina]KAI7833437.1 hypothetical protein BX661DRAFT_178387 [Kickxella alabastrina]
MLQLTFELDAATTKVLCCILFATSNAVHVFLPVSISLFIVQFAFSLMYLEALAASSYILLINAVCSTRSLSLKWPVRCSIRRKLS